VRRRALERVVLSAGSDFRRRLYGLRALAGSVSLDAVRQLVLWQDRRTMAASDDGLEEMAAFAAGCPRIGTLCVLVSEQYASPFAILWRQSPPCAASLSSLILYYLPDTDAFWAMLAALPSLRQLGLRSDYKRRVEGLPTASVRPPNGVAGVFELRTLLLDVANALDDVHLSFLTAGCELRRLVIVSCGFTSDAIAAAILRSSSTLEELLIDDRRHETMWSPIPSPHYDAPIMACRRLKRLHWVETDVCYPSTSPALLAHLPSLPLYDLGLHSTSASLDTIKALVTALPLLRIVSVTDAGYADDDPAHYDGDEQGEELEAWLAERGIEWRDISWYDKALPCE
jgi:hypothetical protein